MSKYRRTPKIHIFIFPLSVSYLQAAFLSSPITATEPVFANTFVF